MDNLNRKVEFLERGSCEPLKMIVHATTLALAAVMGVYNAAAWVQRREQHLAVNAVLYAALIAWEREHVAHHLQACQRTAPTRSTGPAEIVADESRSDRARRLAVAVRVLIAQTASRVSRPANTSRAA